MKQAVAALEEIAHWSQTLQDNAAMQNMGMSLWLLSVSVAESALPPLRQAISDAAMQQLTDVQQNMERQWKSLTDREIADIACEHHPGKGGTYISFTRHIETVLKEKNYD